MSRPTDRDVYRMALLLHAHSASHREDGDEQLAELFQRAAVSKIYYFAFYRARDFVRARTDHPTKPVEHRDLLRWFEARHEDTKIHVHLRHLRTWRVNADYYFERDCINFQKAIHVADLFSAAIDRLLSLPDPESLSGEIPE